MALDAVIGLAGAETKVGQALLLAKQILQMKEMMMDLKNLTPKAKRQLEKLLSIQHKMFQVCKNRFPSKHNYNSGGNRTGNKYYEYC